MASFVGNEEVCDSTAQLSIRTVIEARKKTNEHQTAILRLQGSEADRQSIDHYYVPVFKVGSRMGRSAADELSQQNVSAEQSHHSNRDSNIDAQAIQRLPGGATLGLSVEQDWGRDRNANNVAGTSASRSSQYYYQIEAKQPLLRGAGRAASAELDSSKISLKSAQLSFDKFVQDDLLKTVSLYSELISSQQSVLQAERSLQASQDFLAATNVQVSQGVLANSERDQAEYALAQSQLDLAYAQQQQKAVVDQLLIFSGLVLHTEQAVRELPVLAVDNSLLSKPFPEFASDIELAELDVRVAEYRKVTAKSDDEAELNVVASYGKGWGERAYSDEFEKNQGSGWRSRSYLGLEFKKTLNDYSARAALRRSSLYLAEKERALSDAKLRVSVTRAGVLREFYNARQHLQLIKKKIELAKKNSDNERFKISAGRSTAFLVYVAQSSLAQAQSEYIEAASRYVVAAAKLYREQGRLADFIDAISADSCNFSK